MVEGIAGRHKALGLVLSADVRRALLKVPRHLFTEGDADLEDANADQAIVTKRDERGVSVSSVSARWLQAMMIGQAEPEDPDAVPAAILAKTLGIHVQAAMQWQKLSAGDWAAYAVDVSRRPGHTHGPTGQA
jgi:protein-L-isoaspartate O-methyltransferase